MLYLIRKFSVVQWNLNGIWRPNEIKPTKPLSPKQKKLFYNLHVPKDSF